ncbi:Carboxylic ester hydrolase [Mycena kentingensis (nom. inval.)]|nr:Carboxylic ester hydrolase [Mycena kentingensis (nom. inval.)]
MLPLLAAQLLSVYTGVFLYGIYIVTMGFAGKTLLTLPNGAWRTPREINWVLAVVFVVLYAVDTLDLVLVLVQAMDAFVFYTGPGGPATVFQRGSAWITMTKTACVGTQSIIGDAILIWRCWFVWRDRAPWVAIPPAITWVANNVVNAMVLQLLSKVTQGLVTGKAIQPWGEAFWILTICINTTTTALIVYRLYGVEKNNAQFRHGQVSANTTFSDRVRTPLGQAMRNIVESGAIITISSILMCIAFTTQSTLNFPASALAFHSVGIAFNLIIIRSVKKPQKEAPTTVASIQFNSTVPNNAGGYGGIRATTTIVTDAKDRDAYQLSPIQEQHPFGRANSSEMEHYAV